MIRVRPAVAADAALLAPKLRAADLRELAAASKETPLSLLEHGIASSNPCYAIVDTHDAPIALFGASPDTRRANAGLVWLLASDELVKYSLVFLRHGRTWLDRLHERYELLWNYVDARNEEHIRWLQWCGFTFLRRVEEHGVERRPFYQFARRRG